MNYLNADIELVQQLSYSESQLKELNNTINNLSKELEKITLIKEENKNLETVHKYNQEDILIYKAQINELKETEKTNNEKIMELRKENEELTKIKDIKEEQKQDNRNSSINNIRDLSLSLGLDFINENDNNNEENNINDNNEESNNNNKKIEIKEEIQKKKTDYEIKFIELKEKCNQFHEDVEQQNLIKGNYKEYLNEINQKLNIYNERLNVSSINNEINTDYDKNLDDIYKQIDNITLIIIELDKIIFEIKNIFGENIENLLNEIQQNLINIDNKQYETEEDLKNFIQKIGNKIDEIQSICFIFEEKKNNFFDKNKNIEKEINILNKKVDKLDKYKNNNDNNSNSNNNSNNIEYNNNEDNENNDNQGAFITQSFLFGVKDQSWKYKTHILFDNQQDIMDEYYDQPTLLKKNWHEICYVYDDYNIRDIYYDIKAVGLSRGSYFPTGTHGFYYDTKYEIQSFLVNGVESNYRRRGYAIVFNLNLYNFQTATIYIRYKESKDLDKLTLEEIEERKMYRYEYFGLERFLAGQMAKFSLILKGNFEIVNFNDYFFIKNTKNANENEYFWGGRVPYEGKKTLIILSKNKANWSFYISKKFHSNRNIRNTSLYSPIEFVGGNNEIINISANSPQTSNIILDGERRQYITKYYNINDNKGEFILKGELQNKCKGEWQVDLTDEQIENLIPQENKLCKGQLQIIAKKIIEEFDKNNKNKEFEFLDYMKIALWVKKNIKYDLNYVGRDEMTAIDIYNMKVGVCHHFTVLSNALLYSLGYKVLYIGGYVCKNNKEFNRDSGHAWSLIKVNNKWYPFDATWGIVSGKLPGGPIFGYFSHLGYNVRGTDRLEFETEIVKGKMIS